MLFARISWERGNVAINIKFLPKAPPTYNCTLDSLGKGGILTPIVDGKTQEKERIPFICEADLPIRLPPFLILQPLYSQHQTQLRRRNFKKDKEFLKNISGDGIDWEDIKYCRYLRIPKQRKQDKNKPKEELDGSNKYGKYFFS